GTDIPKNCANFGHKHLEHPSGSGRLSGMLAAFAAVAGNFRNPKIKSILGTLDPVGNSVSIEFNILY
ncbi:hypothetical protein PPACK8108_LOCUS3740, partial [Phakopsora pachyrhizi]